MYTARVRITTTELNLFKKHQESTYRFIHRSFCKRYSLVRVLLALRFFLALILRHHSRLTYHELCLVGIPVQRDWMTTGNVFRCLQLTSETPVYNCGLTSCIVTFLFFKEKQTWTFLCSTNSYFRCPSHQLLYTKFNLRIRILLIQSRRVVLLSFVHVELILFPASRFKIKELYSVCFNIPDIKMWIWTPIRLKM